MIDTKSRAIVWGVGLYVGVWIAVLVVAVLLGQGLYGAGGVKAAAYSSLAGGAAGLVALLVMVVAVVARQPLAGVLGGTLVRMGFALAGIFTLPKLFPDLENQGLVPVSLGVYFVVLVTETLISLSWMKPGSAEKG
jgi:hypothetical protein